RGAAHVHLVADPGATVAPSRAIAAHRDAAMAPPQVRGSAAVKASLMRGVVKRRLAGGGVSP
ncbi:hypothetical protein, partial [Bradyrhizobium canariense]|uniref:hypothetical protein n=1 Tax=Bradyrhizobium canariense TaxID=255045 RepID=UPI001AEC89E2